MKPRFNKRSGGIRSGVMAGSRAVFVFLCAVTLWGCSNNENKPVVSGKEAVEAGKKPVYAAAVKIPGDPEAGKKVYNKYCHFCHGTQGRGDGPVSIGISPHPADFTTDTKRMAKTDQELLKSLNDGIKREIGGEAMFMPSWKTILTEQEKVDVIAYVRLLAQAGRKNAAEVGRR